jgi:type IX secretion system PorP/SprF family membrane protein
MSPMTRLFIAMFLLCRFLSNGIAQDIHFSQYFNTPMLVNPAHTGEFKGNGRFVANYRNQWNLVTANPFTTYAFAFDRSFLKNALSAGFMAFRDQGGDAEMGITQVNFFLASRVPVGRYDFLKLGINGAWSQQSVHMSGLTWNSQFDGNIINPSLNSGEILNDGQFSYVDFSTGLRWTHALKKEAVLNLGISAYHVSRPVYSYFSRSGRLMIRWCLQAELEVPLPEKQIVVYPSLLIMEQGPHREFNAGAMTRFVLDRYSLYTGYYKATYLYLGAYYRYGDAFIAYMRINYKNQFNIGISYDLNLSKLTVASHTGGGTEITLQYIIPGKSQSRLSK